MRKKCLQYLFERIAFEIIGIENKGAIMNTSYILMMVTILSKIFGLAREKALAYFFGTSVVAEIFLIAFQLPMTFTNVISGAVANGFIPVYDDISANRSREEADEFMANLSNLLGVVAIIVSVLGIIFARPLVKLMADGFEGQVLEQAVFMSRIAMVSIFATAVASIFKAYLQIKGKFIVSVSHAIVMNIIIIFFMAISKKLGISYLAVGIAVAFIFQYAIFWPAVKRSHYHHSMSLRVHDPEVRRLLRLILPILISTSAIELNFMISRSLASGLFEGGISTLNYAYKLQSFVTGIVVTSIITATYPKMARHGSKKDYEGLAMSCGQALSTMALLVIPASLGLLVLSYPIVRLLFVGGEFSKQDAAMTSVVLMYYAVGIVGIGFREIVSRIYYSVQDTKTPVFNSVVIVGINIILSFVLSRFMGIRGLALATSLSFLIGAATLMIQAKKIVPYVMDRRSIENLIKIIISSVTMAVVARVCFQLMPKALGSNLALIVSILAAGAVYALALIVLGVDEVRDFLNKLFPKGFDFWYNRSNTK